METNTLSILPAHYDVAFIIAKAGVVNHFGYEAKADGIHFRYQLDDYDAVQAAIASYPVDFLERLVPLKLTEASYTRDVRIGAFEFNGIAIPMTAETRANLTSAALGLERNTELVTIEWSLGGGQFISVPRDAMLAMADAAFLYVQKAFAAHRVIADRIKAAQNINELMALDIENHEAWTA